jgi:hypothetical protein
VPDGISAVVHAEPPACVGAELGAEDAVVPAGEPVDGAAVEPDAVTEPAPAAPSEPDEDAEGDADVVAVEVELPTLDPAPFFAVLPEHPAVSATAPSAPAAARTVIRFMGPNLPG